MKKLKNKVIKSHGFDVDVASVSKVDEQSGITHIHVTATAGTTIYTEPLVFGAASGLSSSDYGVEQMQKDLDAHREHVASVAAFREKMKQLHEQLE